MSDVKPKKWTAGCADELWKVAITVRDMQSADQAINWLASTLTMFPNDNIAALDLIKQMSGKQIVEAIIAYRVGLEKALQAGWEANKNQASIDDAS